MTTPQRLIGALVVLSASSIQARAQDASGTAGQECSADADCAKGLECSASERCLAPLAPAPARPAPTSYRRYAFRVFAADALSVGVSALLLDARANEAALAVGLGGLLLGSPAVHWTQGSPARAAGSLGLRTAVFGTVVWLSATIEDAEEGPLVFGILASPVVFALDYLWLARRPIYANDTETSGHETLRTLPFVSATRGGWTLGLTGRF